MSRAEPTAQPEQRGVTGVVRAFYEVVCAPDQVEAAARDIALEQTVEVPEKLVRSEAVRRVVGDVAAIERVEAADGGERFSVAIDYDASLVSSQLPQLLNLLYGNISIRKTSFSVRLVDVEMPETLPGAFRGPRFGGPGLRAVTGVYGRPLLATALKPRGSAVSHLASLAGSFAAGGGDVVKDDHNLVEEDLDAFKRRVAACQRAVADANETTGRRCLYLPNLTGPVDRLGELARFLANEGISGGLIAPLVTGLDVARDLAERTGLVLMAHPTFAGTFFHDRNHGVEPGLLLGTLFRLAGMDASIFPNFGGRFDLTDTNTRSIADHLRRPLGGLRPALPAPAGGMKLRSIPAMAEQYGPDAIFLVGGALLGSDQSLEKSTAEMRDAVARSFEESLVEPQPISGSACELPTERSQDGLAEHLPFDASRFAWEGRSGKAYKAADASATLPFKDVTRHELLGRSGEASAFDLRYFEIGPGGYSSREKHRHTHGIIAARGRGVLTMDDRRIELAPYDVAYVPPMRVHQFLNACETEPFGFFCIVDRVRDQPMPP